MTKTVQLNVQIVDGEIYRNSSIHLKVIRSKIKVTKFYNILLRNAP